MINKALLNPVILSLAVSLNISIYSSSQVKDPMSHTSLTEIQGKRTQTQQMVEVGAHYYHYRNPQLLYKVIDIGIQEATEKPCVIYKALYEDGIIWVRDLDSWLAEAEYNGKKVPRFQKAQ